MEDREKEAIRYLGYGRHAVDDQTLALIRDAFKELDETARQRIVYRIFDLRLLGDDCIMMADLKIKSRDLARNLTGCAQGLLLGATLGIETDRLIERYSVTDMPRAVVLQACGSALLEEYLDDWSLMMSEKMGKEGLYLRPRFSPGYGDFSITYQKDILRMLDAAKKIGLTMTEGSMLTPTKSVTAAIGLSTQQIGCHRKGCELCSKLDCAYRRDTAG